MRPVPAGRQVYMESGRGSNASGGGVSGTP